MGPTCKTYLLPLLRQRMTEGELQERQAGHDAGDGWWRGMDEEQNGMLAT